MTGFSALPPAPPSLIETLRVEAGGGMPLLEGHLSRLRRSAHALGYPVPDEPSLRTVITDCVRQLDIRQWWRLRLLLNPDGTTRLEHTVMDAPAARYTVRMAGPRAAVDGPWLLHKTTYRPWYADATTWLASQSEVFDLLYWNENGEMSEGSRSNLYMQAPDGRWLTPPLQAGVLPGVQRQALLEAGLVHEAPIRHEDFLRAPALRISNALRGWRDAVLSQDIAR